MTQKARQIRMAPNWMRKMLPTGLAVSDLWITRSLSIPLHQRFAPIGILQRTFRSAFALDYQVPDERISVSVVNGYVTLTGNVDWYYQKDAAEKDVARIRGVQGLDDEITVKQPGATAAEIASGIAQAFQRNARLYDDHIKVKAESGHVTLSGTTDAWKLSAATRAERKYWNNLSSRNVVVPCATRGAMASGFPPMRHCLSRPDVIATDNFQEENDEHHDSWRGQHGSRHRHPPGRWRQLGHTDEP